MRSVQEALVEILSTLPTVGAETVPLSSAVGRVLAEDIKARRTHPEHDISAMDGYAVREDDIANLPKTLTIVEEIPAGNLPQKALKKGETSRIFTGAPLPEGADRIVLQEDTDVLGDNRVSIRAVEGKPHVRVRGLDFKEGAVCARKGTRLTPAHIGLIAAANVATLPVYKRPRVALLSTGSELVLPGEPVGPGQIVSSNGVMLSALVEQNGGAPIDLGPVRDDEAAIIAASHGFEGADICVTIGGASVGKHDLVQSVLSKKGLDVAFWKIAMRPGKPLIFGHFKGAPFLGLPGNPVSSFVCGLLFLGPAIRSMGGEAPLSGPKTQKLKTASALKANGPRETYLRAVAPTHKSGWVEVLNVQDSAMLSALAAADYLVIRPANAPEAPVGTTVSVLSLK